MNFFSYHLKPPYLLAIGLNALALSPSTTSSADAQWIKREMTVKIGSADFCGGPDKGLSASPSTM